MQGSAQPWDLPEDPPDKTVDLPRIDLTSYGNGAGRQLTGGSRLRNGAARVQPPDTARGQSSPPDTAHGESSPPGQRPADSITDPYALPSPGPGSGLLDRPGTPPPEPSQPPAAQQAPGTDSQAPSPPEPADEGQADESGRVDSSLGDRLAEIPERRPARAVRGRPAAGSLADLRMRLDRLPDGHPSSPYEDGGTLKPLPHRLRQLELGLPAPERDSVWPDLPTVAVDPEHAGDATTAAARNSAAAVDQDGGPGQPVSEADSGHDPYATATTANGQRDREGRDDGRVRLERWSTATSSADATDDEAPGEDAPMRQHESATRGRQTRAPDADHADVVARMVAACRSAEGQNVFGGYGESGLTPAIRRVAAQLEHGGLAPGSEPESLKSPERLAAKLARLAARYPDRPAAELAAGIGDAVRYAFAFEPAHYTDCTWLVHRKLKAQGFELEARRNRWESPEYKGIWTRWHDPAHDVAFEVQFHTFASWDVIRRTHRAYLVISNPDTSPAERARLRARQVSAAATAKPPPGCAEIADFGREAH